MDAVKLDLSLSERNTDRGFLRTVLRKIFGSKREEDGS
jgi:hypothetical protein